MYTLYVHNNIINSKGENVVKYNSNENTECTYQKDIIRQPTNRKCYDYGYHHFYHLQIFKNIKKITDLKIIYNITLKTVTFLLDLAILTSLEFSASPGVLLPQTTTAMLIYVNNRTAKGMQYWSTNNATL